MIAISSDYYSRKRVDEVPKYLVTAMSSAYYSSDKCESRSGGPFKYLVTATSSFAASRNFAPDVPKYFVIAISSSFCSMNLVTVVSRYLFIFESSSNYASRSMSIKYFVTAISSSAC